MYGTNRSYQQPLAAQDQSPQSKSACAKHWTNVFEWGHIPVGLLGDALSSPDFVAELEQVRTNHAALTGMFVAGAPNHLSINLNPTKRLANGTPVIYHSLSFKPEDQAKVDNLIADQR